MKKSRNYLSTLCGVGMGVVALTCVDVARAIPFASGLTNVTIGGTNFVRFIMNEAGASVSLVTGDGVSNVLSSSMAVGTNYGVIGTNTTFKVYASKAGNGTPAQITTDTKAFNQWTTPRGMDIMKNPKIGSHFGRIIIANATTSTTTGGFARAQGLYALNADCSDSYLAKGTGATYGSTFTSASTSSPWDLSVNNFDDTIDVADYSTANATIFKFDPDFNVLPNYVVLSPVGENQGYAAGTHGDPTGTFTTGSIATGDLVVWSWEPELGAPASAQLGFGGNGQTTPGQFNCVMRYDIGAGPLPWAGTPNFAVNICLPTFQDSQHGTVTLGPDTTKFYASCYRANLSDGCVQVFDKASGNILYNSLKNGVDVFGSTYAQVRVSPDGNYLAAITLNNVIRVVNLTNGIPDESSLITITDTPSTATGRGLAFDAADNIYEVSQGQGLLRGFSLGISATSVTGNDITGTNGTFQLILPPTAATVLTTGQASQNYINSGGTPIAGVFTVSETTNFNVAPVTVAITMAGTGTNGVNYTINSGTDPITGIIYATNSITFPAGASPGGGVWTANLKVIPTASPLTGPSFTVTFSMVGGLNYILGSPHTATLSIQNTGPQYLFLSAASAGTSMNRGIAGDYAKFTLTRWGDTNGPGNMSGSINASSYTVTNLTYLGSAVYGVDYLAQAQRIDPSGNGAAASPTAGAPGITINPGNTAITCVVGLPVPHTTIYMPPTNATVIISLTNSVTGTNGTSQQNTTYSVGTAAVTVTEIDNSIAPEVTLWSDPLTNNTPTSWTLTYSATNRSSTTILPVVIPNYTNDETSINNGGPNDFAVEFGTPVSNDSVPQSLAMQNNGWSSALRMTVNKNNNNAPGGVNVYPQGQNFIGNVALRFDMYLSLYQYSRGVSSVAAGREFALFGLDHNGTNVNWRPTSTVAAGTGDGLTNWDGVWFAVDAGQGSATPADYDAFTSPPLPNAGGVDTVSAANTAQTGTFKEPPFTDMSTAGGNPANKWVAVDVQKIQSSNGMYAVNMYIDRVSMFTTSVFTTNSTSLANATNGTIMLGYEDPVADGSDNTAFVYFSNVRVVELYPFIGQQPVSALVLAGADVTLTSAASFATAPLTNNWYKGTATAVTALVQSTSSNVTAFTNSLAITGITAGTNYYSLWTDAAGTATSAVAQIEVITGPANVTVTQGAKAIFTVVPSGLAAPTGYQWYTNGVPLVNGTKYTNVTTASLGISNTTPADALVTYTCTVTNTAANINLMVTTQTVTTPGATLSLTAAPMITPATQTVNWGATASFTASSTGTGPFTYGWQKGSVNLTNTPDGHILGADTAVLTITNVTSADAGTYTLKETNSTGALTAANTGVLTVVTPAPTFATPVVSGGNVTLTFSSANSFDTTNAFVLLSAPVVTGPFTNAVGTVFSATNGGFQVTLPQPDPTNNMFYRLQHVP